MVGRKGRGDEGMKSRRKGEESPKREKIKVSQKIIQDLRDAILKETSELIVKYFEWKTEHPERFRCPECGYMLRCSRCHDDLD